jgi:hypothetical protein
MPNWVDNTILVRGSHEELTRFKNHIDTQPEYAQEGDYDGFSFHSFITLPKGADKEVYLGTHGVVAGEEVGKEDINWYNWNTTNWNTKWDACDVDVSLSSLPTGELESIFITYRTAWSPPEPVWPAMSRMFPELLFKFWYEEEQGWGGEVVITDNIITAQHSWDIPDSHADYMAQDKDCVCSWDDDTDSWYEDCPGKCVNVYTIEVVTKMYIQAGNEEQALEAAKAEESGYNLPDDTAVKKVLYSDEYRITNVEEQEVSN